MKKNRKLIEVRGIGFPNKGAELMLLAILQHFKDSGDAFDFGVRAETDYALRAQYPLYQILPDGRRWKPASGLVRAMPDTARNRFGVVQEKAVDIFMDASGFAFGDQWGAGKARTRLGGKIEEWKARGAKVIVMPQAFGPFEDALLRAEMRTILRHADIVCARDRASANFLRQLESNAKISLYPDFTPLLRATLPLSTEFDDRFCLVPNDKIVEMRGSDLAAKYIRFCAEMLKLADERGLNPYVLIHEGALDYALALKIVQATGREFAVVVGKSPLELKGIISRARIVVTSRFHALVSALCQAVPALVIGWSHKYQELLADYGTPELELDITQASETLLKHATAMAFDDGWRAEQRHLLAEGALAHREKIVQMWSEIDAVVASAP